MTNYNNATVTNATKISCIAYVFVALLTFFSTNFWPYFFSKFVFLISSSLREIGKNDGKKKF